MGLFNKTGKAGQGREEENKLMHIIISEAF